MLNFRWAKWRAAMMNKYLNTLAEIQRLCNFRVGGKMKTGMFFADFCKDTVASGYTRMIQNDDEHFAIFANTENGNDWYIVVDRERITFYELRKQNYHGK